LGSDFCGEIAAVGKNVKELEIGDKIIAEPLISCDKCDSCLSGRQNLCQNKKMLGLHTQGALAEYIAVKASSVHRKHENMSNDEAVLIAPLASSIHAIKQAGISIGDLVVILGAGFVGLIALQVARLAGASVIIMDEDSERLHLSADLGADYVLSPSSNDAKELIMAFTKNEGVRFMLDCTSDPTRLAKSIDMLCNGGKIVLMEWTGNNLGQLPLTDIMAKGINLTGSGINYGYFQTAIELVNNGSVNLNSIVSHNYEFREISVAFDELSKGTSDMIKAIIKINNQPD